MEERCENSGNIIQKARFAIDNLNKEYSQRTQILNIFTESYSGAVSSARKFYGNKNTSSGFVGTILYGIGAILLFIVMFFILIIYFIVYYLERNFIYEFINIKLFHEVDSKDRYYNYFALIDILEIIKKNKEDNKIKNIVSNLENRLKSALDDYVTNVKEIDNRYKRDREIRNDFEKLKANMDNAYDMNIDDNFTKILTTLMSGTSTITAASIRAGAKAGALVASAGFKRFSETFTGLLIFILCIYLIIIHKSN